MKHSEPCEIEKNCTGCMACYNACPFEIIEIIEKKDGFKIPKINEKKCIHCNICKKVCPVVHNKNDNHFISSYAAYTKNDDIRKNSSSGGLFTVIAEFIIGQSGVVCGAAFNEFFQVEHICCTKKEDLYKLRGAKYVQSSINNILKEIKEYLEQDRYVYFTGTPCQVAGLKSYLRKEYDKLICSDLICHGVPSPKVWKKYLEDLNMSDIQNISFRDKRYGWKNYSLVIQNSDKEIILDRELNDYMKGFIGNYFLRESCYDCKFKGEDRYGDITLADFWGLDNVIKDFDNEDKGTSFILINSKKGEKIFEEIRHLIIYKKVDVNKVINYNKSAIHSSFQPIQRQRFINIIEKCTYKNTLKSCEKLTIIERIKLKLK